METIKIDKNELLDNLIKNREVHIKEYTELMGLYKKQAIKKVKMLLVDLETKDVDNVSLTIRLDKPRSSEIEYTDAIEMLSYEVEDKITITKREFKQYMKDEWSWSSGFAVSKTAYGI